MIHNTRAFIQGLVMLIAFFIGLALIFAPIINGRNFLEYSDELYNSISKYSANYIGAMREASSEFSGQSVSTTLELKDPALALPIKRLFEKGGATAHATGSTLKISGDLGAILAGCLDDSESMYNNDAKTLVAKYGYNERNVLYNWWVALKALDSSFKKQSMFKEAKVATLVKKKAVETAYNYYTIVPQKITTRLPIILFSLIFYVFYTLWYGFAILFLFEGIGMNFGH